MAYYIRHETWTSKMDGTVYHKQTLVELTAAEARACVHASPAADEADYRRVGADYARAWVKADRHHETALYVDWNGAVRYARDSFANRVREFKANNLDGHY
jgi:hypothetical protein